jgi:NhaA family Na+:H+ antiporter
VSQVKLSSKLDRPVDNDYDHTLGPAIAEITLVEYGSYACPYCRAANERIAQVRDQLGDRLRYVFRHYPLTGSDIALRAAELVEHAKDAKSFWDAHIALMTRSEALTEEDLIAVARDLGMPLPDPNLAREADERAKARVHADIKSAQVSHALVTPTFFINGRRYDDPWDESSFADAMLGAPGHRLRGVALDFADWAPSAGVLLLLATILAVALTNSSLGTSFVALWEQYLSISIGGAEFGMSLLHWINDGLLAIFFLVVGLEIKREFTVGRLASARSAALPVAAAVGGTAFAVALIVMMGNRVPAELRVFLTAAAIVDDIGAITVVAIFYSGTINFGYLAGTAAIVAALALLNRSHIYSVTPYIFLGLVLWACVLASGLHATMAGVILALFIPTRQPPNLTALMVQADAILTTEARRSGEILRHGPSLPAMRALDAIHDRLESPADRLLRNAGGPSSYVVLPLFALANAGVAVTADALTGHEPLMLAIIAGLVIGKPLGLVSASAIAVWLGIATKPDEYSWRQLIGAGALAGIGFTMSLFIASQAFPTETDFAAAKIAVFAASIASAILGVAILWNAGGQRVGNRGQ